MDINSYTLETIQTREAIRDCLTRFCRGMDRFDRELFLSAFHSDAIIAAGPFVGSPADCYDWAKELHTQGQKATQHCILNITLDIQNDTIHVETYYQFLARNSDDSNWLASGRYIDRFDLRNSQWKIAIRNNIIEWSGNVPSLPLPFADISDLNDNGSAEREKTDISYKRPLTNQRKLNTP